MTRKQKVKQGIWLARVGGLSPVKQRGNDTAPERRGFYAFVWPEFEPFLLSGTGAEIWRGKSDGGRLVRLQEGKEKIRKFYYEGELWTRLDLKKLVRKTKRPYGQKCRAWYLVHSSDLASAIGQHKAREMGEATKYGFPANLGAVSKVFAADHWEVFVPAHGRKNPTDQWHKVLEVHSGNYRLEMWEMGRDEAGAIFSSKISIFRDTGRSAQRLGDLHLGSSGRQALWLLLEAIDDLTSLSRASVMSGPLRDMNWDDVEGQEEELAALLSKAAVRLAAVQAHLSHREADFLDHLRTVPCWLGRS